MYSACAHETDSQARPLSAAGLERRQGRSAAYSNSAEPEAARQASLPAPPPLAEACLAYASRQALMASIDSAAPTTGSATNEPPELKTKPAIKTRRVLQQNRRYSGSRRSTRFHHRGVARFLGRKSENISNVDDDCQCRTAVGANRSFSAPHIAKKICVKLLCPICGAR